MAAILNEEPRNSNGTKAWDSANGHLSSVLRLTTTGATRSILLKFERKNARPGDGRQAWFALTNKYKNTPRQRRGTLLRHLDNSVMRSDINPDMFFSKVFQLSDELSDLNEFVFNERLTTIILDALPKDMYSIVKVQSIRDPGLELEEKNSITKTIFTNYSEISSVPKRSQESCRKSRDSGHEPTMYGRESVLNTTVTCHDCKRPGHKKKDCTQLIKRPNKRRWSTY